MLFIYFYTSERNTVVETSAAVLGGMAVAGLAYGTDYYIVPKRLNGIGGRCSPRRVESSPMAL